jgi:hypothetical protein
MPTPSARACPKLSNATDKPATGLDANILKACKASLDAALTVSAANAVGLGGAVDTPQLEQATALSGICVPHFWQNIVAFLSLWGTSENCFSVLMFHCSHREPRSLPRQWLFQQS